MVRLTDMGVADRQHLLDKRCPRLPGTPWVQPPPLAAARVALITTAGLHRRDDRPFPLASAGFRRIADDVDPGEILMSHSSPNFDRSGFLRDVNVAFPLERLHELVAAGEVGSAAPRHYAFMGAYQEPESYEPGAEAVAGELHAHGVQVAFITPV